MPVLIGLTRLRFDVEVFDLLPSSLPAVAGLKLYQEYFANASELIVTLRGRTAEQTERAAEALAGNLRAATNLVDSVTWEPPWLEHPEQSAELIGYLWFNQPPDQFAGLTNRLAPDKLVTVLSSTRQELAMSMSPQEIGRLSYDPFGLTRLPEQTAGAAPAFGQGQELFSSPDGRFRVLFIRARPVLRTYRDCDQWLAAIQARTRAALAEAGDSDGILTGYTGRPAFVAEIAIGMERDMTKSIGGTAVIIAVLFWLAHRRVKPMLWLLILLTLILGSTLALGGLVFGTINVVSMGFAAILLGLAVDYAVVHYQEALAQPHLTIPQIRHAIAPSIFWAAVTTIAAFLVLNFGGLPGLGQLGTLVGLGVALAALIMIFEFLPPLFPGRNDLVKTPEANAGMAPSTAVPRNMLSSGGLAGVIRSGIALPATAVLLLFTVVVLCFGFPKIDSTAAALRPRESKAYAAVAEVQTLLSQNREPLWLILGGKTASEVGLRLEEAQRVLLKAKTNGTIAGFNLPTVLWPQPEFQEANRKTARALADEGQLLRQTALTNGFAEQSLALTEGILNTWRAAAVSPTPYWPTNPMSRWIFEKVAAHTATNFFTLGMVTPNPNTASGSNTKAMSDLQAAFPKQGAWLSGWELLGSSIFGRVKANMWKVLVPMCCLVLLSLFLAFKRGLEITLSLAVLALSGLVLLSVMRLTGWSWNLLNLMALPLVLGTGVDYSIFMQLALRRHDGDLRAAYLSVGRALLLCGGTAIAGFGSLAWSSNAGMASLGQVCAVGVGSNMLIAIFLLPVWWKRLVPRYSGSQSQRAGHVQPALPSSPSSLYRLRVWRTGLAVARLLPRSVALRLADVLAVVYWFLASHRRAVVAQNISPALRDNRSIRKVSKALFHQFARKVVDLWRYEAGLPMNGLLGKASGWEHFEQARAQKRGILLLTPHLGNWEFGGPLLTQRGIGLQVLTLAEPDRGFTEMRQASRARWQIETLVVGDDPMAFVEVIKRLEAGATVALLIDRPPPPTAVTVQLFGQPFQASVAAAELARASGCILLPVYIPWENDGYAAHMLPAIPYERTNLRDRAARQELTQQIVRVFEPIIRAHLDQWYHFVPVWGPKQETQRNAE
ncbi:MAG TPA: MMPL family transporter [Patescibacteria group bacterium]|nr:MMPL family transporter [Patescibacteria group bacterium]